MFYLATIREGHAWGDDFSMYIRHAQNIARGEPYAAILCGANMNFDRLRFVAERAEEQLLGARPVVLGLAQPHQRAQRRHELDELDPHELEQNALADDTGRLYYE